MFYELNVEEIAMNIVTGSREKLENKINHLPNGVHVSDVKSLIVN